MTPETDTTTTSAEPVWPRRCALALASDPHACVGDLSAVGLGIQGTVLINRSGCILHAGLRLADSPPSVVFLTCPPPARAPYALAACELARLISAGEYGNVAKAAREMWIAYIGMPSW